MARRSIPERSCTGVSLIPVSGVGEAVSGVTEAVGDEKIGGSGVEGTFNKDMTNDEMTSEAHKQIVKPLSQTCDHIWRASVRNWKKSAYVRTVRYESCLAASFMKKSKPMLV